MPQYKELSVTNLWNQVKEIDELTEYFPNYLENEKPERDYPIAVISTLRPDATKRLVAESNENRFIVKTDDSSKLIKITIDMHESIQRLNQQKGEYIF